MVLRVGLANLVSCLNVDSFEYRLPARFIAEVRKIEMECGGRRTKRQLNGRNGPRLLSRPRHPTPRQPIASLGHPMWDLSRLLKSI